LPLDIDLDENITYTIKLRKIMERIDNPVIGDCLNYHYEEPFEGFNRAIMLIVDLGTKFDTSKATYMLLN
jgi:hypothetical protein